MSRHTRAHRSSRHLLLAVVAFLLLTGLLTAGPAAAHKFTKIDGNDSPGKLDLRAVSVSHTATGLVHTFRTYGPWTAKSLGADSFFLIQIDKNKDRRYERCAFIFYSNRLRGSLTNCRAVFIQFLPVVKLSGTAAKITIPKSLIGNVYWWAGASRWDGPAPCRRGCIDFAPNNFPDILHDMVLPVATMTTTPLRVWENSTDAGLRLPVLGLRRTFRDQVMDRPAPRGRVAVVDERRLGDERGSQGAPIINGAEGTRIGLPRGRERQAGEPEDQPVASRLHPPSMMTTSAPEGAFSPTPASVPDGTAFGGTYSQMSSGTFTYTWTPEPIASSSSSVRGRGRGTSTVTADGGSPTTITDASFPDQPRQTLYSDTTSCATSYVVTWNSGTFGLDAVLG